MLFGVALVSALAIGAIILLVDLLTPAGLSVCDSLEAAEKMLRDAKLDVR
jgi:hypothetical protein